MAVCPACKSCKLDQLNEQWLMACRDCGTTFFLSPMDKNPEKAEKIRKAIIERLNRIQQNLRLKGDHYHANKIEKFKQEYFMKSLASSKDSA